VTKALLGPLLLAIALVSCDAQQPPEYRGGLYFGHGPHLMRYHLRDGSLTVAGHLGDTVIRELDALGPDHLLIAESALVNGRRVPRIAWFDRNTGASADLYAGVHARYLTEAGILVYDDGTDLYAVPQRPGSDNTVIFSHRKNQLTWMIAAAAGVLLFEAGTAGESAIHAWRAPAGPVRKLEALTTICRLHGAIWIDPLQRLACKRRDGLPADAEYLLSDLDATATSPLNLPAGRQFLALAYIERQHALTLREARRSLLGRQVNHAVWIHDLHTGASHRLPGNVNLGESVVYTRF